MNIKKVIIFILSLSLLLSLYNCDDQYAAQPSEPAGTATLPSTWKGQLQYVMNNQRACLFEDQGLKLVSYELADSSRANIESVKAEILNGQTLVPVYLDSINYNNFEILPLSEISDKFPVAEERYNKKKQEIINYYRDCDLRVVKLFWNYKGESFTTLCLVSQKLKRVVYDDILLNISYIEIEEKETTGMATPRLKTKSEKPGPVAFRVFDIVVNAKYPWGSIGATASCNVKVDGTRYSDGSISIDTHKEEAAYYADAGFSANAKINVTSFVPGKNGHYEYQYAVAANNFGGGISFGWNGSGFTLPSGTGGKTGSQRVIPSMLD